MRLKENTIVNCF